MFHNVNRGSISTCCYSEDPGFITPNCHDYTNQDLGGGVTVHLGLTTSVYRRQQGLRCTSCFSGLGSVNAKNLLIAWRAFANAPAASVTVIVK